MHLRRAMLHLWIEAMEQLGLSRWVTWSDNGFSGKSSPDTKYKPRSIALREQNGTIQCIERWLRLAAHCWHAGPGLAVTHSLSGGCFGSEVSRWRRSQSVSAVMAAPHLKDGPPTAQKEAAAISLPLPFMRTTQGLKVKVHRKPLPQALLFPCHFNSFPLTHVVMSQLHMCFSLRKPYMGPWVIETPWLFIIYAI